MRLVVRARKNSNLLPWIICFLGALFYCYEYLLRISPSVMSFQLMRDYHLTAQSYSYLFASYYYIYSPMQIAVGLLMDRYGPRNLLLLAISSCLIGLYLFVCSPYIVVADIGRFFIGFGSAFAFVGVLKLASIWLPPNKFAVIAGMASALGMLGGLTGDILMVHVVGIYGWRLTCYYTLIVGAVLLILVYCLVTDGNNQSQFRSNEVVLLNYSKIFKGLKRILADKQIWINGLIGCFLYLPLTAFAESWAVPFFRETANFSHAQAGFASGMIFLGWAIGAPIIGVISDNIEKRRLPMIIGAIVSCICACIIFFVPLHHNVNLIYGLLILFGASASAHVLIFPVCRELTTLALTGTAIAVTNMIVMSSGILVNLIGTILVHVGKVQVKSGVVIYSLHSFKIAFLVIPILLLLTLVLCYFLKETGCKQQISNGWLD